MKLKFADKRRCELQEAINTWVESGESYRIDTELDPERPEELPIYAEALQEPPIRDWGVMIGEVCHDLRSALDHLVWSLVEMKNEPPARSRVLPPFARWSRIYFPIWRVPGPKFRPDHPKKMIRWKDKPPSGLKWGLSPGLIEKIEGYQPFRSGQDAPRHPLAVLHELNNIDKHRHIHLLVQTAEFYMIQHEWHFANNGPFFLMKTRTFAPRVGEGRQEIARLLRTDNKRFTEPDLEDKPGLLFDIKFDEGPPAYGGRIIETLVRLHDFVAAMLIDFESDFPKP